MAEKSVNKVKFTVVTPYKNFFEKKVSSVILPTLDGEIGFMPGHTPLVLALKPGIVTVRIDDEISHFTVSEGYAEVGQHLVLAVCNAAESPEEIHVRWIREALDEANEDREKILKIEDLDARAYALKEVDQKIARAKARIHLIELYGSDHQKERLVELELI